MVHGWTVATLLAWCKSRAQRGPSLLHSAARFILTPSTAYVLATLSLAMLSYGVGRSVERDVQRQQCYAAIAELLVKVAKKPKKKPCGTCAAMRAKQSAGKPLLPVADPAFTKTAKE